MMKRQMRASEQQPSTSKRRRMDESESSSEEEDSSSESEEESSDSGSDSGSDNERLPTLEEVENDSRIHLIVYKRMSPRIEITVGDDGQETRRHFMTYLIAWENRRKFPDPTWCGEGYVESSEILLKLYAKHEEEFNIWRETGEFKSFPSEYRRAKIKVKRQPQLRRRWVDLLQRETEATLDHTFLDKLIDKTPVFHTLYPWEQLFFYCYYKMIVMFLAENFREPMDYWYGYDDYKRLAEIMQFPSWTYKKDTVRYQNYPFQKLKHVYRN